MRLRVVFLTHYTELYGANRSLIDLVRGLADHGVEAYVLCPAPGAVTEALLGLGVRVGIAPFKSWVTTRRRFAAAVYRLLRNASLVIPLARELRTWKPDVIYTNSSVTPMGAMLAALLRRPHVWHLREFSDLDYGLQYDWGVGVFRGFMGRAAAQIAVSEAIREHHLRGMDPERIHVIYNGVATKDKFDQLRTLACCDSQRKQGYEFVMVGLLHASKGQDTAIRALALVACRHPGVKLSIAGSGNPSYLQECQQLALELGVAEQVRFLGYVDDPFSAFLAADVALMCSQHEAMGRTTVEAMAACRPVIGLDSAGTSELVEHEHNGLLYRGGHEALAECMCRLVENPAWAKEMGQNGWLAAREKYSVETYAERVHSVLKSVVKTPQEV